jgi:hypothetical protein
MNEMKRIVVGDTTEALVRSIFDQRTMQENSGEKSLNAANRSLTLKDMRAQVMAFIKRNANSRFSITFQELNLNKTTTISFTNYDEDPDEEPVGDYVFDMSEDFTKCEITQKVKIGKDIKLFISSK